MKPNRLFIADSPSGSWGVRRPVIVKHAMLDTVDVFSHDGNMIADPFAAAGSVDQTDEKFFNFSELIENGEHQFE